VRVSLSSMLPKVPLLLVVEVYLLFNYYFLQRCSSISIFVLYGWFIYSSAIACYLYLLFLYIFPTQFVWCYYVLQCVSYIPCVIDVLAVDADLLHLEMS
jgi:ABC-type transport system involved in cytochrome bd biosynthesis fused ATPase/permease subunit